MELSPRIYRSKPHARRPPFYIIIYPRAVFFLLRSSGEKVWVEIDGTPHLISRRAAAQILRSFRNANLPLWRLTPNLSLYRVIAELPYRPKKPQVPPPVNAAYTFDHGGSLVTICTNAITRVPTLNHIPIKRKTAAVLLKHYRPTHVLTITRTSAFKETP